MDAKTLAARLVMVAARCGADEIETTRANVLPTVRDLGVGGIIVFGGERASVADLVSEARADAPGPLLVASDLERGLGWQVDGGTRLPSPMAIAATGDVDLAFEAGLLTAVEARSVGIDLVLAPVADLADRPDNPIVANRSFGDQPLRVSAYVDAFVKGCRMGGAACAAKHFPGHGRTTVDSHIELPVVEATEDSLRERELAVFRRAVAAGVDAVMTAHVAYPSLDESGAPATFSRRIVREILRREFAFGGLVLSDALIMGGAGASAEESARRAFLAGHDILLMPPDVKAAVAAVAELAASDEERALELERAAERVESLALRVRSAGTPADSPADLPNRIASGAATLLRGPVAPRFVRGADELVVVLAGEKRRLPETSALVDRLEEEARIRRVIRVDEEGGGVEAASERVAHAGAAIIALYDEPAAWRGSPYPAESLLSAVQRLISAARTPVLVLCSPPFVLKALDVACPVVCVWDTAPSSERAAADVLLGAEAPGVAPVRVPGS